MSKTISVRVVPVKRGQYSGQCSHDMRTAKKTPWYVDRDMTPQNSVIIEPPKEEDLLLDIKEKRKAAHQQEVKEEKMRIGISGIITFGHDAQTIINSMSIQDQDMMYKNVAERISEELGHELIGLVVHRDESAPHAHFMLRGYKEQIQVKQLKNEDGTKSFHMVNSQIPYRVSKKVLGELQDVAGDCVAPLGITRGTHKKTRIENGEDPTTYIHKSVKELHQDLFDIATRRKTIESLDEMIAERQEKVEALGKELEEIVQKKEEEERKYEKNTRLAKKQEERLMEQQGEIDENDKNLQIYRRRAEKALATIEELENKEKVVRERLKYAEEVSPPPEPKSVTVNVKKGWWAGEEREMMDPKEVKEWGKSLAQWAVAQYLDKEAELKRREEEQKRREEETKRERREAMRIKQEGMNDKEIAQAILAKVQKKSPDTYTEILEELHERYRKNVTSQVMTPRGTMSL